MPDGSVGRRRVRAAHERSNGSYGPPRILEDLREAGHRVGQKRSPRLMRHEGLQDVSKRRLLARSRRDIPEAALAPDLVKQAFTGTTPIQLRVVV